MCAPHGQPRWWWWCQFSRVSSMGSGGSGPSFQPRSPRAACQSDAVWQAPASVLLPSLRGLSTGRQGSNSTIFSPFQSCGWHILILRHTNCFWKKTCSDKFVNIATEQHFLTFCSCKVHFTRVRVRPVTAILKCTQCKAEINQYISQLRSRWRCSPTC